MNDLMEIFNTFKFQHIELGSNDEKPVVIFTGFRDDTLTNLFIEKGFEVNETCVDEVDEEERAQYHFDFAV